MWKTSLIATLLAVFSLGVYAEVPAGTYTARFGGNECGKLDILSSGLANYVAYNCSTGDVTYRARSVTIEEKDDGRYLFKIDKARYLAKQKSGKFVGRWSLGSWSKTITFST